MKRNELLEQNIFATRFIKNQCKSTTPIQIECKPIHYRNFAEKRKNAKNFFLRLKKYGKSVPSFVVVVTFWKIYRYRHRPYFFLQKSVSILSLLLK